MLPKTSYVYRINYEGLRLALNVNFTEDGSEVKGYLKPVHPLLLNNTESKKPDLIFNKKIYSFKMRMIKNDKMETMNEMQSQGETANSAIALVGNLISIALVISAVGGGGGAAVKLLRLFKVIYR